MKGLIYVLTLCVFIVVFFIVMVYLISTVNPPKIYFDQSASTKKTTTITTTTTTKKPKPRQQVDSVVDLLARQGLINLQQERSIMNEPDLNSRSSNHEYKLLRKHSSDVNHHDFVIDLMDLKGFHRLNVSVDINNMGMVLDTNIEDNNSFISKFWVGDIIKFVVEENAKEISASY